MLATIDKPKRTRKPKGGAYTVGPHRVEVGHALPLLRAMLPRSVDLVFTSPPYEDARTYEDGMPDGQKFTLKGQAWVDWLSPIVAECARVSNGLVCVNMSSPVRQFRYCPAVEWLVADLTRNFGLVCGPSPYAWVKAAGIPGSGSLDYHRRDWEPIYAFALPDRLPLAWSDNTAFGAPPKYPPGGGFTNRSKNGERKDNWVDSPGYSPPEIANPGNVIRADVGGGRLGSRTAHRGEAPMPVGVPERFVCWYAPPVGRVLDPFCGTGTTLVAAAMHGRVGIGFDIRESQVALTRRRLRETTPALTGTV